MTKDPSAPPRAITDLRITDQERVAAGGASRFARPAIAVLLLVLLGGGIVAYRRNPPWMQAARGAEYDTAVVGERGPDDVALDLSGFVRPYRKVNISPRIPGTITQLPIDVGQKVGKGDLLAQLDDASYQADLQQALAGLQAAQSALDEARNGAQQEELAQAETALDAAKSKLGFITAEVQRTRKLTDSTSQSELDQLLSAQSDAQASVSTLEQKLHLLRKGARPERVSALEAQVKQAEALVAKAQYFLDNARIHAPMDGTVLEKSAEVGEILRPEVLTASLCILADLSIMEVEIDVQERDLYKVQVGRPCKIIPDAYADHPYAGRINRFQPQVNRARGVVRVTIRIDEPDSLLLPDMNVRAQILNPPSDTAQADSLWAPDAAVTRADSQAWVFVLQNGCAIRREVQVGNKDGREIQILSGVAKDDVLVLAGDKRLVDGQTVRLKKPAK